MSPARAAAEAAVRTSKAAIVKVGHAALKNTALAAQAGSSAPAVQAFGPPGLVDPMHLSVGGAGVVSPLAAAPSVHIAAVASAVGAAGATIVCFLRLLIPSPPRPPFTLRLPRLSVLYLPSRLPDWRPPRAPSRSPCPVCQRLPCGWWSRRPLCVRGLAHASPPPVSVGGPRARCGTFSTSWCPLLRTAARCPCRSTLGRRCASGAR